MNRWRSVLGRFLSVNLLTQTAALVVGVLVVRGLDKEDYAAYAVFSSFLAAFILLTDSGMSGAVVGIAMRQEGNAQNTAALYRTAYKLQRRLAAPQVVVGSLSVGGVLWAIDAQPETVLILSIGFILVCAPLLSRSISVAYRRSSRDYGRLQLMNGLNAAVRLLVVGLLTVAKSVSLVALMLLTVASNVLDILVLRRGASDAAPMRGQTSEPIARELRGVYFRALPVSIGVVVQTQLVTVMIGLVGGADVLAEIAALSRFAAVLAVFAALVNDVGAALVASSRSSMGSLMRSYRSVIGLFVAASLAVAVVIGISAPALLWLLGDAYSGLELPLVIVALGTAGIMTADAMRVLNNTLGWARWSWAYIPLMLAWLILGVCVFDLRDVVQAAFWMAAQAFVGLGTQTIVLVAGARGERPH